MSLADRLGDSGVTGLAILRVAGDEASIETLLLSCRIIGRRVEDALLAFLATRAEERGARTLRGRFVANGRNAQAESFYPDRGFALDGDTYVLDLARSVPAPPDAVVVEVRAGA